MSVQFEPAPVRPRRPLSDRLLAIGAGLLVIAVALAVAKPWNQPPLPEPSARAVATPSPTRPSEPSPSPDQLAAIDAGPVVDDAVAPIVIDWDVLRGVVHAHARPGIEAILQVPHPARSGRSGPYIAGGGIVTGKEAWTAIPAGGLVPLAAAAAAPRAVPNATVTTSGLRVVAIGVTMPPERRPLDVRFWRLGRDGSSPERLDVSDPPGANVNGVRLFVLPPGQLGSVTPWSPGTYLVEVLGGSSIEQARFQIPGAETDAARDVLPPDSALVTDQELVRLGMALPAASVFTIDRGASGISWESTPTGALDERSIWLGSTAAATAPGGGTATAGGTAAGTSGTPGGGTARNTSANTSAVPPGAVALATVLQPIGIGLRLPTGGSLRSVRLVQVAPAERTLAAVAWPLPPGVPAVAPEAGAPLPIPGGVVFRPAAGRIWPAGVYRLDVVWQVETGENGNLNLRGSWVLDLARHERGATPAELVAARTWAAFAGGYGFALGGVGSTVAPPLFIPRRLRVAPTAAAPDVSQAGYCDTATIVDTEQILGVTYPAARTPEHVALVRRFDGGRSLGVPIAQVPSAVPGLWLVEPLGADRWDPGFYDLELVGPGLTRHLPLCVGVAAASTISVRIDGGSTSLAAYEAARRRYRSQASSTAPGA